MAKSFTLSQFCELANWAHEWISTAGHFEWGFTTLQAPERVYPQDDVMIESHCLASAFMWDELRKNGPRFCAAVKDWHDEILTSKPAFGDYSGRIGLLTFAREPAAIPVDRDLSALHLMATWIEKFGWGICGQKQWQTAVNSRSIVTPSEKDDARAIKFVARLCLYCDGVEALCREVQRELACLRSIRQATSIASSDPSIPQAKADKLGAPKLNVQARAVAYVVQQNDPGLTYADIAVAIDASEKYLMAKSMTILKAAIAAVKLGQRRTPPRGSKNKGTLEAVGENGLDIDGIDRRIGWSEK